ncbi:MAG: hypothetical protein H0U97_01205 [Gammaproteobacteria bacterium]|nr:hypothetical protein [Gammaproteobacteria bacterium]
MSGPRLGSFRAGDRSEYLGAYVLSRVAYVNPIPRQEDFGLVDFLCVLARAESGYVYPESAFYVQVKSNSKPFDLSGEAIKWLAHHMDHPLFVCVVDKAQSLISLYSCIYLWRAVFLSRVEPESIRIEFGSDAAVRVVTPNTLKYVVNLGLPILHQTIADIESEPETAYAVLRDWIALDAANIARRRIGRVAVTTPVKWEANVAPLSDPAPAVYNEYFMGPYYELVEKDLAPILTALAHNYRHAKKEPELTALCGFLDKIRKFLDGHGLEFADGKLTVEKATERKP